MRNKNLLTFIFTLFFGLVVFLVPSPAKAQELCDPNWPLSTVGFCAQNAGTGKVYRCVKDGSGVHWQEDPSCTPGTGGGGTNNGGGGGGGGNTSATLCDPNWPLSTEGFCATNGADKQNYRCTRVDGSLKWVKDASCVPGTGGTGGGGTTQPNDYQSYPPNQVICGANACVLSCDCSGDGKTDRMLATNTVTGRQAAAHCAQYVCSAPGTNGKTCQPGQINCISGTTRGYVCKDDGSGYHTTAVDAHQCGSVSGAKCGDVITENNLKVSLRKEFVGCQGTKNCYKDCFDPNRTVTCYNEPGISCGANVGVPTTPPASTPPQQPPPNNPPPPPPTPTPLPFQCVNITTTNTTPKAGDQVTFTCGQVSGAATYEFRYSRADSTDESQQTQAVALAASSNPRVSQPLTVEQGKKYNVQCRPCKADGTCTPWEPLEGVDSWESFNISVNNAVNGGYTVEKTEGYVHTSAGTGLTPFYMLWNKYTHDHVYTQEGEKNYLLNRGWENQGISFYASTTEESGLTPVFRAAFLQHVPAGTPGSITIDGTTLGKASDHIFTTDEAEYTRLTTQEEWIGEGTKFYISSQQTEGTSPWIQLMFDRNGAKDHYYVPYVKNVQRPCSLNFGVSAPIAPQCNAITPSKSTPQLGDEVSFTCAGGPEGVVTRYEFRYGVATGATLAESQMQSLAAAQGTPNVSVPITVDRIGRYYAQCRPCTANTCLEWEPVSL